MKKVFCPERKNLNYLKKNNAQKRKYNVVIKKGTARRPEVWEEGGLYYTGHDVNVLREGQVRCTTGSCTSLRMNGNVDYGKERVKRSAWRYTAISYPHT